MPTAGIGALASLGVLKEAVEYTGEDMASAVYLPMVSETMTANRASVPSNSLLGNRMRTNIALGIQTANGGFTMEVEGSAFGVALNLWNGNENGYTVAAVGGYATAAPTGAAAAGGTLTAGDYKYQVATVLTRATDGRLIIMPGSTASANITTASSNLTADIAWTPVAAPTGYSIAGYAIFRTSGTAGSGSRYFLHYQAGTGSTYSDTGALTLDLTVTTYTSIPYNHTFKGTTSIDNTDPISAFSMIINQNNDNAVRFVGCRMGEMTITAGDLNSAITAEFGVQARQAGNVDNETPSFTPLEPFVTWSGKAYIDGVADCTLESFTLNANNNVQPLGGMCAQPYNRGSISGQRTISCSFTRQFETHDFWDKMLAGSEFSLRFTAFGQPVVATGSTLSTSKGHAIDATPFQYFLDITLHSLRISKAGGNVSGPEQIKETVEADAFFNAVAGTEMTIVLSNITADYNP